MSEAFEVIPSSAELLLLLPSYREHENGEETFGPSRQWASPTSTRLLGSTQLRPAYDTTQSALKRELTVMSLGASFKPRLDALEDANG